MTKLSTDPHPPLLVHVVVEWPQIGFHEKKNCYDIHRCLGAIFEKLLTSLKDWNPSPAKGDLYVVMSYSPRWVVTTVYTIYYIL